MTRRSRFFITLGLAVGLLLTLLIWRVTREGEFTPLSPLAPATTQTPPAFWSPLAPSTATSIDSPVPVPPTGTPPVNDATLEAIRTTRPTTTPLATSSAKRPYISPSTWRRWALWVLGTAGVLAYIGLRLRRNQ